MSGRRGPSGPIWNCSGFPRTHSNSSRRNSFYRFRRGSGRLLTRDSFDGRAAFTWWIGLGMTTVLTNLMAPLTGRSPAVYGAFLLADDTAVTRRGKRIVLALQAFGCGERIGGGSVIWKVVVDKFVGVLHCGFTFDLSSFFGDYN